MLAGAEMAGEEVLVSEDIWLKLTVNYLSNKTASMRFQVIKNIIQGACLHKLLCQSVLHMWGSFTSNNWTCWWR